jgi:hypothetical protein
MVFKRGVLFQCHNGIAKIGMMLDVVTSASPRFRKGSGFGKTRLVEAVDALRVDNRHLCPPDVLKR